MVHARAPLPQPDARARMSAFTTLSGSRISLLPSEGGLLDGVPLGRVDTIGLLLVLWIAAHRVRLAWRRRRRRRHRRVSHCDGRGSWRCRSERALLCHRRRHRRRARTEHRVSTTRRSRASIDDSISCRGDARFPSGVLQRPRALQFHAARPARSPVPGRLPSPGTDGGGSSQAPHLVRACAGRRRRRSRSTHRPLLRVTPASGDQTIAINLTGGWHRLHVTISSPYGASREFSAGEIVNGQRRAFDDASVRTERIDGRQMIVLRSAQGRQIRPPTCCSWRGCRSWPRCC